MEGKKADKAMRYRKYVESGIEKDDEEFLTDPEQSAGSTGSGKFRQWVDECYAELLRQSVAADLLRLGDYPCAA